MLALGLLLSALIGGTLGLLGGGGSIMTVPTIHYVFGLDAHDAISTSLAVVAITGFAALIPHARAGRVRWRIGVLYAVASMAGAYGAARVARYLPSAVLLVAFGAVMLVTAVGMLRARPTRRAPGHHVPVVALVTQAVAVGAVSGLVGAGGGFLIVPSLVMLVGLPMPQAVGTSLLVIVMNATAAFAGTSANVPVHGRLVVMVAGTAAIGSIAGAYLASRVKPEGLRALFGWFVLITGIIVFGQELPRALGYQVTLAHDWPWMLGLVAILGSAAASWRFRRSSGNTKGAPMVFRQLFDPVSSTYTYLLGDEATREAIIIDPVFEQVERDIAAIQGLGLRLVYALDTHVHADHVTALGTLRERLGARTVVSERAGVGCADVLVKDGDAIRFGAHRVDILETPGHTAGCVTYVTGDRQMAFTGDALLIRGCGRTDFQQGDAHQLFRSIHDKLFTLPAQTVIYPGHDYQGRTTTTVDEERRSNPRLGGGKTQDEFVAIMSKLALAHPRQIDLAVPRNARCGRELVTGEVAVNKSWAPVEISVGGIPEVAPEWVAARARDVRLIDVRELDELRSELGHIEGIESVPLATLDSVLHATPRDRPLVFVCRSGGRSGKAALAAAGLGFEQVASMRGGMITWNQRYYPVTRPAAT